MPPTLGQSEEIAMSAPNVLLASKGHPFQREPFFQMFDAFQQEGEISAWTHVEQPAAQLFFQPENSRDYDCIVDYSMPGVFGVGGPPDPPEALKDGYMRLTEEGKGLVMIHHNICSWPGWEEYAEIIGGRFFYNPGSLRGVDYPDSGYLLAANHTCEVVAEEADHPVVQGVDLSFELQDEIYLAPYHEDSLVPLVRSDFDFTYKNFFSPSLVVNDGRMYERGDWTHPPTPNLVVWAKNYRNSPIVYVQAGDVPTSYNNSNYRRLLANAIKWVASDEAHEWARARNAAAVS
ncbi:MAG: ThuA domain-containing protein [Dehalococcoidia bacterium]|nr:ThuA domain-containing protein [Dehalococcoidia bacterium]MYD28450.1 ThuA domain-containing protein [Dehalococcoidia bacterium]